MNRILLISIFCLLASVVFSQRTEADSLSMVDVAADTTLQDDLTVLPLNEAINAAIAENHDILIAEKETERAENNNFIGNAGLLPSLTANGGYNWNLKNTNIEFATPVQEPINRENAESSTLNGSIMINYTIFSGLSRFYRLNSLQRSDQRQANPTDSGKYRVSGNPAVF